MLEQTLPGILFLLIAAFMAVTLLMMNLMMKRMIDLVQSMTDSNMHMITSLSVHQMAVQEVLEEEFNVDIDELAKEKAEELEKDLEEEL